MSKPFAPILRLSFCLLAACGQQTEPTANPATPTTDKPSAYVGAEACGSCHAPQYQQWLGSHHQQAMAPANEQTVLGNFDDQWFQYGNVRSHFFRAQDGSFWVNTDGRDGQLADYRIAYTFGVYPLQQYLIEFDDGRLQALGIAWDARPTAEGGQRWYHLYPDQAVDYRHHLHWTAPDQNWNYMCAECHSTQLRKNFQAASDRFDTRYEALNVSCEACHGPGRQHLQWAASGNSTQADKGLALLLDERRGVQWAIDPHSDQPRRSSPRTGRKEIDNCGRCHSRRSLLNENFVHGQPLGNTHRLALLNSGIYHPDGQPDDENYVYGSFLQSKMQHLGVTCSDCHNPHTADLKLPGDGVCAQCHAPAKYASRQHHFHPPDSAGARCAECHMPVTRYMGVDDRHDHSFRVPRPDLSVSLGTPNACTNCHQQQGAEWAREQVRSWYGRDAMSFQRYAEAFAAGRRGDPHSLPALLALPADANQPVMARASALELLAGFPGPASNAALRHSQQDPDPLVRRAAAEGLGALGDTAPLLKLLTDPVLAVRLAAALGLASLDPAQLAPTSSRQLARVLNEYEMSQQLHAERADAQTNLGTLYARQGRAQDAERAFRRALARDPTYVPAIVNLADLLRAGNRDPEALKLLTDSDQRLPRESAVKLALALAQIRQNDYTSALPNLELAHQLAPGDARTAYIYAVLLYELKRPEQAMAVLEQQLQRQPYQRDLLNAQISYGTELGRADTVASATARLQALDTALNGGQPPAAAASRP